MKILVIADRPPEHSIIQTCAENTIDLIITLGDLDYFSLEELQRITDIPKIGVYGNHCSGTYFKSLGIQDMHLQTVQFGDLTFGGFQGSVRYKSNPDAIMYHQEEATQLLADFPRVDIMLTHCPPYGINDEIGDPAHEGFRALRDYIERHKPKTLLHGHTYPTEDEIIHRYDETDIIYVHKDQIVTL